MKLVVSGWFQSQYDPNKLVRDMSKGKVEWIAKRLETEPDSFFITSFGELIEANFKFVRKDDNWETHQKRYIKSASHLKLIANSLAHFIAIISSKGFVEILAEDEEGYSRTLYNVIDGIIWQKRSVEFYSPISQPFEKISIKLEFLWRDIWGKIEKELLKRKDQLPTFDHKTPTYEQEKDCRETCEDNPG